VPAAVEFVRKAVWWVGAVVCACRSDVFWFAGGSQTRQQPYFGLGCGEDCRGAAEQQADLLVVSGLLPRDACCGGFVRCAVWWVKAVCVNNDELGLLDDGNDSIFTIRNVPKSITMPDKIARRQRCENFETFEPLFKQCHAELKSSLRDQRKFTGEQQIQKGQFFILHGVMCYVSDIEERVKKNGKLNAKLHLIFENGTESNMLLRSLAT
jgi:hypothetical protein